MSFLDDLRDSIERIKRKLGISWQKLLDQIPDSDRLDSYRYDEILKAYVLKSVMPENEVFILDEDRRVNVSALKAKVSYYGVLTTETGKEIKIIKKDCIFNRCSILFNVATGTINLKIKLFNGTSYITVKDTDYTAANYNQLFSFVPCEQLIYQIDATGGVVSYQLIFFFYENYDLLDEDDLVSDSDIDPASQQSIKAFVEGKISDIAYNESTWNAVTTITPSKNSIRDWIQTHLIADAHHDEDHTHEEEDITDLGNYLENVVEDPIPILISSEAISIKPSGDVDDYLDFLTSAGVPRIKVIGGDYLDIESDDFSVLKRTIFRILYGSEALTFTVDDDGNYCVIAYTNNIYFQGAGVIYFRPSGDTDDYIQFSTTGDIPKIEFVGGNGKIENVVDPTNDQDVATKKWVTDNFVAK